MQNLGVIGGGAMGSAIISGLLAKAFLPPANLFLLETDQTKTAYFEAELKIRVVTSGAALAAHCDTIILAVKPHILPEVARELAPATGARHCLLSIAAGVLLSDLENWFPAARIVRVMPNTLLRVGRGVSVYCPGKTATIADQQLAARLFGALGQVLQLPERQFDAVTAVSGSGPAYVFYLMEAMIDAAVMLGLGRTEASRMVTETFAGSAALLQQTAEHPAKLRNDVTSPGGTTAAALFELEKGAVTAAIIRAVAAAAQRSQELGRKT
jgi:pyrroline-5-carboxylate reductase